MKRHTAEALREAQDDLAYHQLRVLMLVDYVSAAPGHAGKLDGLTKLAKLDFLVRYPGLMAVVLDTVNPTDRRLHLEASTALSATDVEAPMIRYRYGPWDDRYYPVIGALVGRGLLRYGRGRRGSVALLPTRLGREMVADARSTEAWHALADRCAVVAEATANMTGNALKQLIYERLPELLDRPHRQVIR